MDKPLSQSVMNQKTEAKPRGNLGERSQGGARRSRREEARSRRPLGLRLGPSRGHASPHWAKSVFSASFRRSPAAALTVTGGQFARVVHAITSDARLAPITGEVPPCPAKTRVKAGYKRATKGQPQARATVTVSCRHRPRGCQQRQSSPLTPDERQNLKQPLRAPVTRIVSPGTAATKWPAGTSSRQPPGPLSNTPTGTAAALDWPSTTFQDNS
jgi:hypothetical protein